MVFARTEKNPYLSMPLQYVNRSAFPLYPTANALLRTESRCRPQPNSTHTQAPLLLNRLLRL
jgi:hypothetical protein